MINLGVSHLRKYGEMSNLPSSSAHINMEENPKGISSEEQICFYIPLATDDFEKALLNRILLICTLEDELKTRQKWANIQ
jgi:hypothetical protein